MSIFEQLKNKYPVKKLGMYGDCIIISKEEFGEGDHKKQAELEDALKKEGYMVHFLDVGDPDHRMKFAVQLRKADVYTKEVFPEPPKQPKITLEPMKEIVQHRAKGGNNWKKVWTVEEDKLLVNLWNQEPRLTVSKIAAEYQKTYPKRTELSLCNRISALQVEGEIPRRIGPKAEKSKPNATMEAKNKPEPDVEGDRAGFSRQAEAQDKQVEAASTALTNRDLEQLGKITDALLKITEPINNRISALEAENIELREEIRKINENLSVVEVTWTIQFQKQISDLESTLGEYIQKFEQHEHSKRTGLPLVPP